MSTFTDVKWELTLKGASVVLDPEDLPASLADTYLLGLLEDLYMSGQSVKELSLTHRLPEKEVAILISHARNYGLVETEGL